MIFIENAQKMLGPQKINWKPWFDDFASEIISKHSTCRKSDQMFTREPETRNQKNLVANPTTTALQIFGHQFLHVVFHFFQFNVSMSVRSPQLNAKIVCNVSSFKQLASMYTNVWSNTPRIIKAENVRMKRMVFDYSTKCGIIFILKFLK